MSAKAESLKLKKWAVIGATNKKHRYGYKIVKSLADNDYEVFPVNPRLEEIDGIKCYADIDEIEETIDVVDMVVRPEIGREIIPKIGARNIEYLWLQPGTRSKEIDELAEEHDIKVIKDCIYATLA
ncbi:MAG: CoA-binding protein [Bacillota bacterium]